MIMRLKCEVGCEKKQLRPLLGKNEITFRTTQYLSTRNAMIAYLYFLSWIGGRWSHRL